MHALWFIFISFVWWSDLYFNCRQLVYLNRSCKASYYFSDCLWFIFDSCRKYFLIVTFCIVMFLFFSGNSQNCSCLVNFWLMLNSNLCVCVCVLIWTLLFPKWVRTCGDIGSIVFTVLGWLFVVFFSQLHCVSLWCLVFYWSDFWCCMVGLLRWFRMLSLFRFVMYIFLCFILLRMFCLFCL